MELETLKRQSNVSVLLRGKSGRGKTHTACKTVLECLADGASVKYIDTENEGSTTLVSIVENGDYDDSVVEELEYVNVNNYEALKRELSGVDEFGLVVVDTLDHKHSYVLKEVTDARMKAEAEWNEYAKIYSEEKEFMTNLSSLNTNLLATLDPDSGKDSKPKGAQTNIHGYFSIVVDLYRDGNTWKHKIENWVGRSDLVGEGISNVEIWEAVATEIMDRQPEKEAAT